MHREEHPGRLIRVDDVARALMGRVPRTRPLSDLTPAAVLVLLRDGPEGVEVLLTRRSEHVRDHKGQVSLPGGAVEPSDPDTLHAALRESAEEVGLDPARVQVLGRLDDYTTITGYHVIPWVGAIASFEGLRPMTDEIERVFAFPLRAIADPARLMRIPADHPDGFGEVLVCHYDGEVVWGATARMLMGLWEVVS